MATPGGLARSNQRRSCRWSGRSVWNRFHFVGGAFDPPRWIGMTHSPAAA